MPNTTKPCSRPPLFTPSTLPPSGTPDPVVAFIEGALLAIANRQDEAEIPEPPQVGEIQTAAPSEGSD